jgi:hypothetical protein
MHSHKALRLVIGAVAVFLTLCNVVASSVVMKRWTAPNFAADECLLYDVRPVADYLQSRGITRAYASWHVAYRLSYITDERIMCAQFFNERFFGWPIPYKDEVDAATNVAFVLHPRFPLPPQEFENDLAAAGIAARAEPFGDFRVYTDFARREPRPESEVAAAQLTATVSDCPAERSALTDGNPLTRWRSHRAQEKGMWVAVQLPAPTSLCAVALCYNLYARDQARALNVLARTATGWRAVAQSVPAALDAMQFRNGHPVYGDEIQTIRFDPVITDQLRIEIAEPEPGRDWTIGEIGVRTGDRW